jgi:hypothetical protein
VNLVFTALEKTDMRINRPKYIFYTKEVEFLNYIVGLEKIKINLKKIEIVKNWSKPVL